jgi:hypothetical protein
MFGLPNALTVGKKGGGTSAAAGPISGLSGDRSITCGNWMSWFR